MLFKENGGKSSVQTAARCPLRSGSWPAISCSSVRWRQFLESHHGAAFDVAPGKRPTWNLMAWTWKTMFLYNPWFSGSSRNRGVGGIASVRVVFGLCRMESRDAFASCLLPFNFAPGDRTTYLVSVWTYHGPHGVGPTRF